MSNAKKPAEIVRSHLERYVGPHTSKNAVDMMSKVALNTDADHVRRDQVPALLDALGPMLRTLLGTKSAELVVGEIKKELAL